MFSSLTRAFTLTVTMTLTAGWQAAEPSQASTKMVVKSNSDFAIDLYRQLAKENEGMNLFFSPYSISSALAMTAEGARGETAEQMGSVLRFPKETRRVGDDAQLIPWHTSVIHTSMAKLQARLNAKPEPAEVKAINERIATLRKQVDAKKAEQQKLRNQRDKWQEWRRANAEEKKLVAQLNEQLSKLDQYEVRVANALWAEKTYPFKKTYLGTINAHYDTGGAFPVDFRGNYKQVRKDINAWVEDQTNDRIKNLIPEGVLDELTRLVLVNAIYFKGDWSVPFDVKNTKELDFTLSTGKAVKTSIMHARGMAGVSYADFNADGSFFVTPEKVRWNTKEATDAGERGFAMLELPYKGKELSMVVIAPNDPTNLDAIEKQMSRENLTRWFNQLKPRPVHVYLPKFKAETDYELGDAEKPKTLQKMGMVRAFVDPSDPVNGAVFDGMSQATNPMNKLYITKVLHKAFVEVNEKGTEAAAATAVVMAIPKSAPATVPFTPTFKADRPFVYLIRDRVTGSILFMGRMMEPVKD